MASLVPVDTDPFASASPSGTGTGTGTNLVPVDGDPFAQHQPYTGSILPFSRDAQGHIHFDSNAGLLGSIKSALTLPGDVYTGKTDPNSDEGIARAFGLAGMASPMGVASRMSPLSELVTQGEAKVPTPTAEQLYGAADAGYKQARDLGVDYSAPAVRDMAAGLRQQLEQDGILGELAPQTFSVLGKLENPAPGAIAPFGGLEAARRSFGRAAKNFQNPTDQEAAGRAVDAIDQFITNPPQDAVVGGPADRVAQIISDARGNYAAAKRSDRLTDAAYSADLGASAANSGQNIGNSIRQRAKSILLSPSARAGYSPEELDALEQVVKGSPTANAARYVGNLLGGGGGLGSIVTGMAGAATGNETAGTLGAVAGAALPLVGVAAKKAGNYLSQNALDDVANTVRQRSPLFDQMSAEAVPPPPSLARAETASRLQTALLPQPGGQSTLNDLPDRTQFSGIVNTSHRVASLLYGPLGRDRADSYATELARQAISKGVGQEEFAAGLRAAGVKDGLIQRALGMAMKGGLVTAQPQPASP